MPKIKEMYAFVAEDSPGDEGVVAMQLNGNWLPLVGADWEAVESIRQYAQQVALRTGKTITLVRFAERSELETITDK